MNPALKAATRVLAAVRETGAECLYGPPPGMVLPEYRVARSILVSIQATPMTRLVWTASGRTQVSYTAGIPATRRPTGYHAPSRASRCPAGDVIRFGALR